MIGRVSVYHIIPLIAFIVLALFLMQGLYLQPQNIPSVKINQFVPNFELTNLVNGKKLNQTALKGRWTLLNVWASWCGACAIEHPFLMALHKQGVNLVGLNYKDKAETAKSWLANYGNPYQVVLFDDLGKVAIDFGVYGSPETFLIDKEGVIRYRHIGILTPDAWQQAFLPLISQEVT